MSSSKKPPDSSYLRSKTSVVAGQAASFFGGTVFFAIVGFLLNIYVSRVLGAHLLGVFSLALSIVMLLSTIGRLGFPNALVKFIPTYIAQDQQHKLAGLVNRAFLSAGLASLFLMFVLIWLRDWLAIQVFDETELGFALLVMAALVPINSMLFMALFSARGFQKVNVQVAVQRYFITLTKFAVVAALFFLGWRLEARIAAEIVAVGAGMLIMLFFVRRMLREGNSQGTPASFDVQNVWPYARLMFIISIFTSINQYADRIFIGGLETSTEVGIYHNAVRMAFYVSIFLESINSIFAPVAAETYARNKIAELQNLYATVTKWTLFLTAPLFVTICVFPETFLGVFGPEFREGALAFVILSSGHVINAAVGPAGNVLLMTGNEKKEMWNNFINTGLSLLLLATLIPHWGIVGAAIAYTTTLIVVNLIKLGLVVRYVKIHPYTLRMLLLIPAGAVATYGAYLIKQFVALNEYLVLLLALFGCYIFFIAILFTVGLEPEDGWLTDKLKQKLGFKA